MKKFILIFLLILFEVKIYSQQYMLPVLPDTTEYGRYTSRTMHLLQSATPENRVRVKILVYGQSISVQDWWLEVKRSIEDLYPDADLIMENKSIGGFSTQYLCKTVEMDVSTFYPDLVLLHIYGNDVLYDSVLNTIRSRTAAEVAIQTDHFAGENAWSDTMSYYILPRLAEKYKCDLINIRDPWKRYLSDHNFAPKDLLKDDIHLNKHGEFLMAELIKPLFQYKSKFKPDPFGLCSTLVVGQDVFFKNGKLVLPFSGNKVDIITSIIESTDTFSSDVLIDDRHPSEFQGTYFMTRPYNSDGKSWPWNLPAMIQVRHEVQWITEEWTCTFNDAVAPYEDFSFSIEGSVTGKDGSGKASEDFISPSKRVMIKSGDVEKGGDWHLNRSFRVLKTVLNPGDEVKWKTYSISMDKFPSGKIQELKSNECLTLFQGVPNKSHVLKIISYGKGKLPVKEVRVYRPFYNR